ncbi:hypothetical protein ACRAKI_12865 [Saccharothrix isguenensis]
MDPEIPKAPFRGYATFLEDYQELQPSDEEMVDVSRMYSFYVVLVLRYAALCRFTVDVEYALKCAHACLTAMGQLDRNISDASFFSQEVELQWYATSVSLSEDRSKGALSQLRDGDRLVARERLAAIQRRFSE